VGSRRRYDRESVVKLVRSLDLDLDVVVSGGCRGVDTWAAEEAKKLGLPVIVHRPVLTSTMTYAERAHRCQKQPGARS